MTGGKSRLVSVFLVSFELSIATVFIQRLKYLSDPD